MRGGGGTRRNHEAPGLGGGELLDSSGVQDGGTVHCGGEWMLNEGDTEPIDEVGASGQQVVLNQEGVEEQKGFPEGNASTVHEQGQVTGRESHHAATFE